MLFGAFRQVSPVDVDYDKKWNPSDGDLEFWKDFLQKMGKNVQPSVQRIQILGQTHTSYMRQTVYTDLKDGVWSTSPSNLTSFDGGVNGLSSISDKNYSDVRLVIDQPIKGWVPTFKDVYNISGAPSDLKQCDQYDIIGSEAGVTGNVSMRFVVQTFQQGALKGLTVNQSSKYMGIPNDLYAFLVNYTDALLSGITDPYEKAKVIYDDVSNHTFLNSTGISETYWTRDDVVRNFIENRTAAYSLTFASAYVLMARAAGVPARLVKGYHIDPNTDSQYVTINVGDSSANSYAFYYAEIDFNETGWMIVDPTPLADSNSEGNIGHSGRCFMDTNLNGRYDEGEPLLKDVIVQLIQDGKIVQQTYTDENGLYKLADVKSGDYQVNAIYFDLGQQTPNTMSQLFSVGQSGSVTGPDFPFHRATASWAWGKVFYDANANGERDNEYGIFGWNVYLRNLDTGYVMASGCSEQGDYSFSGLSAAITPGNYSISVDLFDGWRVTTLPYTNIYLTSTSTLKGMDIGLYNDNPGKLNTTTTLVSSRSELYRDTNFTASGTVIATPGYTFDGLVVKIYLSPDKSLIGSYLCGEGFVYSSLYSINCIVPHGIPVADYHLIAVTVGNYLYNSSNSDPVVSVRDSSTIELVSGLVYNNGTAKVTMQLTENSTGNGEPWSWLNITEDHVTYQGGTTDADGNLTIYWNFHGIGNHTLTCIFDGGSNLDPVTGTWNVQVFDWNVTLYTEKLIIGYQNTVTGKLMLGPNVPEPINVQLNLTDGLEYTDLTDENGLFFMRCTLPEGTATGRYAAEVQIGTSSVGPFYLNVYAQPDLDMKRNGSNVLITLKDGTEPLAGRTIIYQSPSGNESFRTDEKGQVSVPVLSGTSYTAIATYPGDSTYNLATSSLAITAPAKSDDTWWMAWALVGVIGRGGCVRCLQLQASQGWRRRSCHRPSR